METMEAKKKPGKGRGHNNGGTRPHGRRMPHPHDAKNSDGSIDIEKAKAALPEVTESYETGEYSLKDMNELVEFDAATAAQLSMLLGVSVAEGDELFVAVRKKN